MADGFLGRWSRRKLDGREGKPLDEPATPSPRPSLPASSSLPPGESRDEGAVSLPLPPAGEGRGEGAVGIPSATLEDVKALTPQSDFKPFVARSVAPEVRNAAMKKLFSDPHFNVMDRLDIYIDDYGRPDPLPESMLRQMVSAKFLKLFEEEEEEEEEDEPAAAQSVAKSADRPPGPTENKPGPLEASQTSGSGPADQVSHPVNTEDHANTDLRLQQNHADGAPLAEREPECRPRHGTS